MTADIRKKAFLNNKVVGSNPVTVIALHLMSLVLPWENEKNSTLKRDVISSKTSKNAFKIETMALGPKYARDNKTTKSLSSFSYLKLLLIRGHIRKKNSRLKIKSFDRENRSFILKYIKISFDL